MANQLETVIKRTQATYKQAAEELAKKLADFQKKFAAKDKEKQALLAAGEITQTEYKNWLAGQVFQGKQWEAKAKETAETLVRANEEAAAIVNDGCMTAYAAGMNYGTYELERETGLETGFTLYDRNAVSRLIAKDPQTLPEWKIDEPKDYVWNYNKVKNSITQGIIQGKSIPEITRDLTDKLQTLNENRMRLFARTGMTGAQNAGRIDAMHRAEDKGIKVRKKWMATNDDRTRDAHADLDGQIRDVDDPFESELGPIMYPGDPSADPANVYNCRCTLVYIYPDLEEAPEGTEPAPEFEQMTFDEWMEAKENQEDTREPEPEIMAAAEELEQTRPATQEEALNEYIRQGDGWKESLTEDEQKAVSQYGYNYLSAEANGYLRGETDKYNEAQVEQIQQQVKLLDGAIEKGTISEDLTLYRGVGKDYLGLDFTNPDALVGQTITEGAHMSTTGSIETAEIYGRGVVIQMDVPEGTHAAFVDLAQNDAETMTKWFKEDGDPGNIEYLLQRNGELTFTGYSTEHDKHGNEYLLMRAEFTPTQAEAAKQVVVQGTDISETWTRRPGEFATEIEDVINAQGFDGNPRIVGREEFDQAVKDSGFIAQRTYSAPDQETLDAYRDQLYNGGQGNWYVDCGTGGAQYGQGMYCAADYNGELTDGIKTEMEHYKELSQEREKKAAWDKEKAEIDWKQEWIARDQQEMDKYGEPSLYTRTHGMPTDKEFEIYHKFQTGEAATIRDLPPEEKKIWLEAGDKNLTWNMNELRNSAHERFEENYTGHTYTETITIAPDAHVITYEDAVKGMLVDAFGEEDAAEAGIPDWFEIKDMIDSGLPVQDIGVWAGKHGYDAINAEGHGESGSYTVILNRTKCIILDGRK